MKAKQLYKLKVGTEVEVIGNIKTYKGMKGIKELFNYRFLKILK